MNAEALRATAVDVAYRMLGSRVDAEDIAQEALLRVREPVRRGEVDNPEAYITTVATRLAIDELRSARRRREHYPGPWLPEPIVQTSDDPAELADSVSYAVMVVLDALSPQERAAFLLRDVFGFTYDEIADVLNRTPTACRQLASRGRRRVLQHRPEAPADHTAHARLLGRFLTAASGADVDGLVDLLAEDAVLVSDGGPRRKAARRPIVGRDRVVRFLRSVFPRFAQLHPPRTVEINGEPGFVIETERGVYLAGVIEVTGGRIKRISWVLNPDKLRALDRQP